MWAQDVFLGYEGAVDFLFLISASFNIAVLGKLYTLKQCMDSKTTKFNRLNSLSDTGADKTILKRLQNPSSIRKSYQNTP